MTLLDEQSESLASVDECAALLVDVVPLVMRSVRKEMRRAVPVEISVPQFRSLVFLSRHPGASLSDLAEHVGLTAPSASKLIDGLVERGLVTRETPSHDRRRVRLTLTAAGGAAMEGAREVTVARLSELLGSLPDSERAAIARAMQALRAVFEQDRRGDT